MGAMKDLLIEVDDAVASFETNFRYIGPGAMHPLDQSALRAEAYDAFYDLLNVVHRLIGSSEHGPEAYADADTPKLAKTWAWNPDKAGPIIDALRDLSAQVAALSSAGVSDEAIEEALNEEDETPPTGQTLHIVTADGSAYSIPDVDQFHLAIDETGEWPVAWMIEEEPDEENPNPPHKAGYFIEEEWHAFDSRYRNPKAARSGW